VTWLGGMRDDDRLTSEPGGCRLVNTVHFGMRVITWLRLRVIGAGVTSVRVCFSVGPWASAQLEAPTRSVEARTTNWRKRLPLASLTGGGAIYAPGYSSPEIQAPAAGQQNWRLCNRCQGLFFAGNPTSVYCLPAADTTTRAARITASPHYQRRRLLPLRGRRSRHRNPSRVTHAAGA
jgi:hypothetical protein